MTLITLMSNLGGKACQSLLLLVFEPIDTLIDGPVISHLAAPQMIMQTVGTMLERLGAAQRPKVS